MRAAAARGPAGAEPAASQIFSEDEAHEGLCPTSRRALFLIALGTILRAMGGAVGGIGIERQTGSKCAPESGSALGVSDIPGEEERETLLLASDK